VISSSVFSPCNFTNPPKGKALIEYNVSPIFFPKSLGGRPKPNEVVAYWPALVPKNLVAPVVQILEAS